MSELIDMDWQLEFLFVARAVAAALLGGLIGWERETHASDAGIRTYASVALGACVFALISQHIANGDPARIAAQVVSGVGFLGAGAILRHDSGVRGLTTAGTIWATASVGLAMGFGMYVLAMLTALIVVGLLLAHDLPSWQRLKRGHRHNGREGTQ